MKLPVLVIRPYPGARESALHFERQGHEVTVRPLLSVEYLVSYVKGTQQAILRHINASLLEEGTFKTKTPIFFIFTSGHAVLALAPFFMHLFEELAADHVKISFLCVGNKTKQKIEQEIIEKQAPYFLHSSFSVCAENASLLFRWIVKNIVNKTEPPPLFIYCRGDYISFDFKKQLSSLLTCIDPIIYKTHPQPILDLVMLFKKHQRWLVPISSKRLFDLFIEEMSDCDLASLVENQKFLSLTPTIEAHVASTLSRMHNKRLI